jgi:hypothetical protein
MSLAVGVRSADPVFLTVIVHFQVVRHLFTAPAITQHGHVWRMVKLEELHAYDFTVTEYVAQAVQIALPWGPGLLLSRERLGLQESSVPFFRNEVLVVENDVEK